MSCSSFEFPDSEFILYTGTPKMLFEIVEENPESEVYTYITHANGDEDYIVIADCFEPDYFKGMSDAEATEKIGNIFGLLEEWYIAEVEDLDNYDD